MKPLILASASPRRRELLTEARIPHQVAPIDVAELSPDQPHGMTPAEFAWRNALRKAITAARQHPERLVLAADTVVALGTRILGKPRDNRQAASFLKALSDRTHEVLTAVVLFTPKSPRPRGFVERTEVTFRKLSSAQISKYLKTVSVLDKAGAYALQENGDWLVRQVRGSHSNVIGLPIERLAQLLRALR